MTITTCPHCHMRVLPRSDGTCPSCNGLIAQTESPPAPKASGVVIKKRAAPPPKKAARKKAAAKRAPSRKPAPPKAREVETLYQEYHRTALEVRRESIRTFLPYLIGGAILCAICTILNFFTWEEVLKADVVRRPSTVSWILIWTGVILLLGSALLGAIKGVQQGRALVRDIAQERAGFPEFYKAFIGRVWPKDGKISGPAYEKFLDIIAIG
jgi:uncharacterized Zn finger protein (UPF0148 family)